MKRGKFKVVANFFIKRAKTLIQDFLNFSPQIHFI